MSRRIALGSLLVLVLFAAPLRAWVERPPARVPCDPQSRGEPPRHFLGCATDASPGRPLEADERLLLGLPLDPNTAAARELAFVPGLSPRLAAQIVKDRQQNGPYREVRDLLRVRGIGPKRLAAATPHLALGPP